MEPEEIEAFPEYYKSVMALAQALALIYNLWI